MSGLYRFLFAAVSILAWTNSLHGQDFVKVTQSPAVSDVSASVGASWIDFDGDGDLDLLVSGTPVNLLYRNDGGSFVKVTEGVLVNDRLSAIGHSCADFDNDGDLDCHVAGSRSALYRNQGGQFSRADELPASGFGVRGWSSAWGDYDLDGFLDLVITHPAGFLGNPVVSNYLFRSDGQGGLTQVTGSPATTGFAPYTIASWSDWDQDGDLDLAIGAGPASNVLGPDFLYTNQLIETGQPDLVSLTDGPLASTQRDGQIINWIDYDNDGDFDAFVTNWGAGFGGLANELYRNDAGTLVRINEGALVTDNDISLASVWGDYDNDGDLDVFVANNNRPNRLYLNNGDGTFSRDDATVLANETPNNAISWGATAGDYDNDGDLDLFVANGGTQIRSEANYLYRNERAVGNWLLLQLVGTVSNRSAIGAKVRAEAVIGGEPVEMLREVSAQNSFAGQNSLRVHFGLGDALQADRLSIEWPSGIVQQLVDVAANQILTVVEAPDADGDGVSDEEEDLASNDGDGNSDGTPDRLQPHVASLQTLDGSQVVTLEAPPSIQLADVRAVANPAPESTPRQAVFPLGFFTFRLLGIPGPDPLEVRWILPAGIELDSYYKFGPTPADQQDHWYNFEPDGSTGADVQASQIILTLVDGQRGDDDLDANGTVMDPGGPALTLNSAFYFPHFVDGQLPGIAFDTSLLLLNCGPQTAQLRVAFLDDDGMPLQVDLGSQGLDSSFELALAPDESVRLTSTGSGDLGVGYVEVLHNQSISGLLIFARSDPASGIRLTEAPVPATGLVESFTLFVDSTGSKDTGLALAYPVSDEDSEAAANLTLRLIDSQGELIAEANQQLIPGQHLSRFVHEFFADQPAAAETAREMEGILQVSSDRPISALTLRQSDDPGLDFPAEVPILTAFPVVPND